VDDKNVTWTEKSESEGGPVTVVYKGTIESATKMTGKVTAVEFSIEGEFKATRLVNAASFQEPYVDTDEWRDKPVRHRYVHGGFKGTEARFSIYFPTKEQYQGRFFQHITPVPMSENLAQRGSGEDDKIGFSIASGGYFLETNEGGMSALAADSDPRIAGYWVNAAAAQYSRGLAAQMYGPHRTYGYAWGGSGGAYRTIGGIENTEGIWDGVVPYVIGSPMAIPNVYTSRILAMRVLKHKFPAILDAVEPGGSGDMYSGLNKEEREVLAEVTRMGFPPRGWYNYKTLGMGAFSFLFDSVVQEDPKYFEEFWTVPGYAGANPTESLLRYRVQNKTTIKKVVKASGAGQTNQVASDGGVNAWQQLPGMRGSVGLQVESAPTGNLEMAYLIVKSGAAAGKMLPVLRVDGDMVVIGSIAAMMMGSGEDYSQIVDSIKDGDEVEIGNANFLAVQYYHRYQVPTPDYYVWNQFRGADGKPLYPQRPQLMGPQFAKSAAGSVPTGQFKGKMIAVENLMDQDALPWQADWYASRVKVALGSRFNDNFRLWYTDCAIHGDFERPGDPTHVVSYLGVLHQALRDLSAWVERGVEPPPSTNYKVVDGQVQVPPTAAERRGIQPVVTVNVNGGARAEVAVGQSVTFSAVIEVPRDTGRVVAAEWDFEGAGDFPVAEQLTPSDMPGTRVTIKTTHGFSKPGTYFPALRAASQRQGDAKTPYARIQNLGRVRVVVN
jgi:hypothetical protein